MGTPLTKAAVISCDSGGTVDLSAVVSNIAVDRNDVIDAADVGLTLAPIIACTGHPPPTPSSPAGPICTSVVRWNVLLSSLADNNQPVAGFAPPPAPVATSNVPIAILTCSDAGNTKLFAV